ncbi:ArgE/DapE family deacylase [Planctomonas psychrotolerans]|uniref:ArgE/DapE family deacylase n=1 Tax=Planctomonas psychrotolerans TaxID=2528712 RepID=UPI00123B0253|nr:ArgE/DapE family deacylase [Planctomonas psychrotolerans]
MTLDPDAPPRPVAPATDPLDVVALASRLIGIDSVNPDLVPGGAGEAAIADFCADWLSARGFEVTRLERQPGRPSILATVRGTGGGSSLMLNGHLDTVGVEGYAGDPFGGSVVDDELQGRGAFDMKGGLAAMLVAAARATAGTALRGDVHLALVADEEFGSAGTVEVLERVTPDAAVVCEPSGLELTLAHRGFAWFDVAFIGRAAHGSMPADGVDAIEHAGRLLVALRELAGRLESAEPHPILGHGSVRVSSIHGGADAATVAASCRLTIERRMLPGETPDDVEAELRGMLTTLTEEDPQVDVRLSRMVARGAFETPPDAPLVRTILAATESVLGQPATTRGEPFWTDAGLFADAGIPCLLLGVDGGGAHAATEWATVASIRSLADILEATLGEWCA